VLRLRPSGNNGSGAWIFQHQRWEASFRNLSKYVIGWVHPDAKQVPPSTHGISIFGPSGRMRKVPRFRATSACCPRRNTGAVVADHLFGVRPIVLFSRHDRRGSRRARQPSCDAIQHRDVIVWDGLKESAPFY